MSESPSSAPPSRRLDAALAGAIGLLTFLLLAVTANDYGLTYDEPTYSGKTVAAAEWMGESLRRAAAGDLLWAFRRTTIDEHWLGTDQKPGLPKLVGAVASAVVRPVVHGLATARAGAWVFASVLVVSIYAFCAPRWGRVAAIFGSLALLFAPRFFAHAHLFATDVPCAATWIITIVTLARLAETGRWRWALASGIAFGLALGTKPNALFIPIAFFLWASLLRRDLLKKGAIALLVIGPVVFWLTWPWLWHAGVTRFWEYVKFYLDLVPHGVTYFGRDAPYAPWHYPFVMLGITTPPITLALAVGGIALAVRRAFRGDKVNAFLLICLAVNFLSASVPTTTRCNGIRLFMPLVPLLVLFAAQGFAKAHELLERRLAASNMGGALSPSWMTVLAVGLAIVPSVRGTVLTHPYQLSYYNSLIGGPRGAARLGMEPTYWGETYMEAVPLINRLVRPDGTVYLSPPGVMSSLMQFYQHSGGIRADVRFNADEELPDADLAVFHTRRMEWTAGARLLVERATPVHTLEIEGVPLLYVFDREGIQAARGQPQTSHQVGAPGRSPSP